MYEAFRFQLLLPTFTGDVVISPAEPPGGLLPSLEVFTGDSANFIDRFVNVTIDPLTLTIPSPGATSTLLAFAIISRRRRA